MNIRKSILVALAVHEKDRKWLQDKLNISRQRLQRIISSKHHISTGTLESLAGAFGMSVSEFVALGEQSAPVEKEVDHAEN